jgi:D-alanine-D-alanine ligase
MASSLRIAVLMGGGTSEHEISLRTGEAVADALLARGHRVDRLVLDALDPDRWLPAVRAVDVVFVALHGGAGEDGRVQSLLELARLPYVGSRPGPSAVAMDKIWTKRIARDIGVPTTEEFVIEPHDARSVVHAAAEALGGSVVLKPAGEGSAVGVHLCPDRAALDRALDATGERHGTWMLEPYVAGRELTVPILWDAVTPVIEIRPHDGFYDYTNKYTKGRTSYDCPADLPPVVADAVAGHALTLYRALHLRDMARIDFRLDPQMRPFLLEVNTIPGMTGTSLLPMGAAATGIDFVELCDRLCRVAHERGPDLP